MLNAKKASFGKGLKSPSLHGQTVLSWSIAALDGLRNGQPWPKDSEGRLLADFGFLAVNDPDWTHEKAEHCLTVELWKATYLERSKDEADPDHETIAQYCKDCYDSLKYAFAEEHARLHTTGTRKLVVASESKVAQYWIKFCACLEGLAGTENGLRLDKDTSLVHWSTLMPPQHELIGLRFLFPGGKVDSGLVAALARLGIASMLDIRMFDPSVLLPLPETRADNPVCPAAQKGNHAAPRSTLVGSPAANDGLASEAETTATVARELGVLRDRLAALEERHKQDMKAWTQTLGEALDDVEELGHDMGGIQRETEKTRTMLMKLAKDFAGFKREQKAMNKMEYGIKPTVEKNLGDAASWWLAPPRTRS